MEQFIVKIGDGRMVIQPEMMKWYAEQGYEIYKMEEIKVDDIEAELANIDSNVHTIDLKEILQKD